MRFPKISITIIHEAAPAQDREQTPAPPASDNEEEKTIGSEPMAGAESSAPDVPERSDAAAEVQETTAGRVRHRLMPPRITDPVFVSAVLLAVVAACCAGWFGYSWYGAAHSASLRYSRLRDTVLRAGEQAVQNLNTLDYRNVNAGIGIWESSSTGDLHNQIMAGRARFVQQVEQARTITTAKILGGAITELDERAGKASLIVALQIIVTPPDGGAPAPKHNRVEAALTRTESGWKLSQLGQAPLTVPSPTPRS